MFKNKIFKYFFEEFLKIFLLILLSFSTLLWITQAVRLLELVTEYGNSVSIYIKYMILSFPKMLDNSYLLCFSISLFFLFGKFNSSKELEIYWLSGIGKKKLASNLFKIGLLAMIFYFVLTSTLSPASLYKARIILSESKFTLINSLVKEKNFNSPLKGLTMYVNKNDNKGNLEGIFIYEKSRTIIAEKGRVLNDNKGSYLELINGFTHEIVNENINIINFKKTIFDFTKYELQNVGYPKFNERNLIWIINELKIPKRDNLNDLREELNKRLIKPLLILALTIISCFLLVSNKDKVNKFKLNFLVYISTFFLIILNEAILGASGKNLINSILYFCFLIILPLILYYLLQKTLNFENK